MKISSTSLLKLLRKEIIDDKFIIRQFYLTDTRETLSKIIDHYEYLPPLSTNDEYECIPTILTHCLFDFIGHIKNQNRPMIIHCGYERSLTLLIQFSFLFFRNGGPTCSIFSMIIILLDQLKTEHAVNIFQSVRALQRQRLGMITSFVGLIMHFCIFNLVCLFLDTIRISL
jgi:protein tyrosine phosphatase